MYVETIALNESKQISSNTFKNGITHKLFIYKPYVYSFKWKQTNCWCYFVTVI